MCQLVMCNFSVFCKYQIKIIVRSPGTRSTGTPQQAKRDAEHPGPSAAPQPQAGHRSSPNRPGAAAQTRGKHKQHHKLPATGDRAGTAQAPRCGLVLVPRAQPRAQRQTSPGRDLGSTGQTARRGLQPQPCAGHALPPAPAADSYRAKRCRCSPGTWRGFPGQPENALQTQK